MTNQWLLPFTFGVDIQALDAALGLVQKGNATLVALSLITVPSGKRSRGVRLEHIQQSQDFLETLKYRAARFAIPIERHELYTENVLESLETLPHKLGCEGVVLVSRGEQALLLNSQEMQHMLSTVPVPLMLVHLPEQTKQSWHSYMMARFASRLQSPWKNIVAKNLDTSRMPSWDGPQLTGVANTPQRPKLFVGRHVKPRREEGEILSH